MALAGFFGFGQTWERQSFLHSISVDCPVKLKPDYQEDPDSHAKNLVGWLGETNGRMYEVAFGDAHPKKDYETTILLTALLRRDAGFVAPKDGPPTVLALRRELLGGWSGYRVQFKTEAGKTLNCRLFVLSNNFVELITGGTTDSQADADKFLTSLQVQIKGSLNTSAPVLHRYKLGDSGMSLLFPVEPSASKGNIGTKESPNAVYNFESGHLLSAYSAAYFDLPVSGPISEQDREDTLKALTEEYLKGQKATNEKSSDVSYGALHALKTEYETDEGTKGYYVVLLKGKRVVNIVEEGPKVYDDPQTINSFLGSLQFK